MSDYNSMNFADEFNTKPEPPVENTPETEKDGYNQTNSPQEERDIPLPQSESENASESVLELFNDIEIQLQRVCDEESIEISSPTQSLTHAEEADSKIDSISPQSDLQERMERAEQIAGELIKQLEKSQKEVENYKAGTDYTKQQYAESELKIANLEKQIEENASAVTESTTGGVDETVVAEKDQRIQQLEKEVEWNRAELERIRFERDNARSDFEDNQANVSDSVKNFQLRVKRLTLVRALLKRQVEENSSAAKSRQSLNDDIQNRLKLAGQIQREKEAINHAARCLSESERTMISKWAKPRAVVTIGWFFMIAVVVAGGSWLATNKLFPATVSASLTVQAKPNPGFPITEEQAKQWNVWHVGQLTDMVFIKTAAKRFENRKIEEYSDPTVLKKYMQEHLSYDSPHPEAIVLTITETSADKAATMLDMIGITLVAESRRQAGKRTDGAGSDIAEERKENGIKKYAVVNNVLVTDDRLTNGAMIFGVAYSFILLLMLAVYNHLAKAKKVFDAAEFVIPDDILEEEVVIR